MSGARAAARRAPTPTKHRPTASHARTNLARAVWISLLILSVQFGAYSAAETAPLNIEAAVLNSARPAADRSRDAARKPAECLALAALKPGDRIADMYPGGGYYSRLFSGAVGPQGRVYALIPHVLAAQFSQMTIDNKAQDADPVSATSWCWSRLWTLLRRPSPSMCSGWGRFITICPMCRWGRRISQP